MYLVLDLETTSKKVFKRVGNPFFNTIVAIGMKTKDELYSKYIYPHTIENLKLEGITVLVGHNIKYDLLYLWEHAELQDFFKRGGQIWDTQYAEYVLSMQQEKYPALRDIATRVYGCPDRPKFIEDLLFNRTEEFYKEQKMLLDAMHNHFGETVVSRLDVINNYWNYQDINELPPELVLKDVESDVLDTEQVYLKQLERAKRLGMYEMLELEMDAILATTEMEYNGLKIDKNILEENKKKLEAELKQEYTNLFTIVKDYWK